MTRPIRAYFQLDGYGPLGRNRRQNHHGEFSTMDGPGDYWEAGMRFEDFWKWLCRGPHQVNNLGCRKGRWFSIEVQGDGGSCTPARTKRKHAFTKEQARRVWDRYHGARAASHAYQGDVHVRAGTYAQPNKPPSSNSWPECPNQKCAPWIAAAIAEFLREHPCGNSKNRNFRQASTPRTRRK